MKLFTQNCSAKVSDLAISGTARSLRTSPTRDLRSTGVRGLETLAQPDVALVAMHLAK